MGQISSGNCLFLKRLEIEVQPRELVSMIGGGLKVRSKAVGVGVVEAGEVELVVERGKMLVLELLLLLRGLTACFLDLFLF